MFKSRCRNCKENAYGISTSCWEAHNSLGECIAWLGDMELFEVPIGTIYCPSDNLEFLEWCLEKKLETR
jgi:hypothetical protein